MNQAVESSGVRSRPTAQQAPNNARGLLPAVLQVYRRMRRWGDVWHSRLARWKLRTTQGIQVPATTHIGPGCRISNAKGRVVIGENTTLVSRVTISGPATIGSNVIIADNCTMVAWNHDYDRGDALPYGTGYVCKPIIIEDNVWVGSNVSIVAGVRVGEGAVIALGAVVTGDVPPCAVVGGNPARVLKYRDREHYQRLVADGKYLNNIRRPLPGLERLVSRNRATFLCELSARGFVLPCQMDAPAQYRAAVLYALSSSTGLGRFGNAGSMHIVVDTSAVQDPAQCAEEIAHTAERAGGTPLDVQSVLRDLTAMLDDG